MSWSESDRELAKRILAEDLGGLGDVTSLWTIPAGLKGQAAIVARSEMVVYGLRLAETVMQEVDPGVAFKALVKEGAEAAAGDRLVTMEGAVRSILTAERSMLNLLSHLSGVATQSRRFAQIVAGTGAVVVDTRKTTPGLRRWEKAAVVAGGCRNHRFGLFDLVLVKNNHLKAAGGVRAALEQVRAAGSPYLKVEVEVESEAELREAVAGGADIIMLDNQNVDSLRRLVAIARALKPQVVLEASGGVTLETVRAVAETGVDLISTSALTMGAPPADVSLTLLATE